MTTINRRHLMLGAGTAALSVALTRHAAHAQAFPSRTIRLVVPSPPGGGTDTLSRVVGTKLDDTLQWQIVPDNRPGAGGNIGMEAATKAAPDGYTIVMGESANLTINPYLYASMSFDPAKDLVPIVLVGTVPLVLVVSPSSNFKSVADLAKAAQSAKEKPLTFASGGNGTVGHLAGELWKRRANINLLHVPYRGGALALTDLMGGQVDLNFASLPAAVGLVASGKLRALAVTSAARLSQLPDVPTMEEAGLPGFTALVVYGLLAPAGTPADIVQRYNAEINKVLGEPDVKEVLAKNGVDRRGGTSAEFGTLLNDERAKWQRVVTEAGVKIEYRVSIRGSS